MLVKQEGWRECPPHGKRLVPRRRTDPKWVVSGTGSAYCNASSTARPRPTAECRVAKAVGEPCAGKPHARFGEGTEARRGRIRSIGTLTRKGRNRRRSQGLHLVIASVPLYLRYEPVFGAMAHIAFAGIPSAPSDGQ